MEENFGMVNKLGSQVSNASWFNRNIMGMGVASLLSDLGHEMATAILPAFLVSIGGSPSVLGVIEGIADGISSFVKLGAGWYSDRIGKRKGIAVLGYTLTGLAKGSFALAHSWIHILIGRSVGWFGRGIRSPVRDALLADSVSPSAYGKAFGFHRGMDTAGAVLGPLAAFLLISYATYRQIFLLTLVPGLLAAAVFAFWIKERPGIANHSLQFWKSYHALPKEFKQFLIGVGIFGIGDFAHTLLILRAVEILKPEYGVRAESLAVLLYVFHNVLYALVSFPIGALSDRMGRMWLLAFGYFLSGVMGICLMFITGSIGYLIIIFILGGIYIAMEDALEGAIAADLLPQELRGTGYGVLATVNGLGDFFSSLIVGFLWSYVSPFYAFGYGAVMSLLGSIIILNLKRD
jgi:MFS family permease